MMNLLYILFHTKTLPIYFPISYCYLLFSKKIIVIIFFSYLIYSSNNTKNTCKVNFCGHCSHEIYGEIWFVELNLCWCCTYVNLIRCGSISRYWSSDSISITYAWFEEVEHVMFLKLESWACRSLGRELLSSNEFQSLKAANFRSYELSSKSYLIELK